MTTPHEPPLDSARRMSTPSSLAQRTAPRWLRSADELCDEAIDARDRAFALVAAADPLTMDSAVLASAGAAFDTAARAAGAWQLAVATIEAEDPPALPERVKESTVAEWLRQLRASAGFTVAEMAAAVGISTATVAKLERGDGTHRAVLALLVAEGMALCFPALDAAALEEELVAEWSSAGRLAPPSEYPPGPWLDSRRKRRRPGLEMLREKARRAALDRWLVTGNRPVSGTR